jgi:hypothetical protein
VINAKGVVSIIVYLPRAVSSPVGEWRYVVTLLPFSLEVYSTCGEHLSLSRSPLRTVLHTILSESKRM